MLERYLQLAEIDLAAPRDRLLFRALVKTKLSYKLRDSGGLSYTRAREIVLEMLGEAGMTRRFTASTASVPEGYQQQPELVCLTDYSRGMADGAVRTPMMATLRMP